VLSLALFPVIGALGIALATSVAAWINAALLAWRLHRSGRLVPDERLRRNAWRMAAASAVMGLTLLVAVAFLEGAWSGSLLIKAAALAALVLGGGVLYGAFVLGMGVVTLAELKRRLRRTAS
jgi:putative peptidoglycan lipid II flippase